MRIEILKPIASMYGGFRPGNVIDIPEVIAEKWCKIGIAKKSKEEASFVVNEGSQVGVEIDGVKAKELKLKPEVIPTGMFWCTRCLLLHRVDKKIGQSHQKYSG